MSALLLPALLLFADMPRFDNFGDPLPPGALVRLGTARMNGSCCALSPDGNTLAVAGNAVSLFAVPGGERLAVLKSAKVLDDGSWGEPKQIKFLDQGRRLAATYGNRPGFLRFWSVADRREIVAHKFEELSENSFYHHPAEDLVVSGDGRRFATRVYLNDEKKNSAVHAVVFDAADGRCVRKISIGLELCTVLALSADGRRLLTASPEKQRTAANTEPREQTHLVLWDVDTGVEVHHMVHPSSGIRRGWMSPDGRWAITSQTETWRVSGGEPLQFWDLTLGRHVAEMGTRSSDVSDVVWTADGSRAYVCGLETREWRITPDGPATGPSYPFETFTDSLVIPVPGKPRAVSYSNGLMPAVCDVTTKRSLLPRNGHANTIAITTFTADGAGVISCALNPRDWHQWEWARGRLLTETPPRWSGGVELYNVWGLTPPATWRVAGGPPPEMPPDPHHEDTEPTFSPDGRLAFSQLGKAKTTSHPTLLSVFDVATMRSVFRTEVHANRVRGHFSADGRWLGLADMTRTPDESGQAGQVELSLWAVRDWRRVGHCCISFVGNKDSLQCWPLNDGRTLLVDSEKSTARWDLLAGRRGETTNLPLRWNSPFSADGRTVTICGNPLQNTADVYETLTLTKRLSCVATANINTFNIHPDGSKLVTGHYDGTLLVWDISPAVGPTPWMKSPTVAATLLRHLGANDAAVAWLALRELVARPTVAVPLLKEAIPATAPPDAANISAWIRDLDSPTYATREAATTALTATVRQAQTTLTRALDANPGPERKERLEKVLATVVVPTESERRQVRAVEVLELIATREAQAVLSAWAAGDPTTLLTQHATGARERLSRVRK